MKHPKYSLSFSLFFAVLAGTLWLPAPVHANGIAINSDTTLTTDLASPVKIVSDNITLNCDGHTITGTGSSSGSGILLEYRTGVTIMNCIVTNFEHGITLYESTDITLKGNTTFSNLEDGIELSESDGNVVKHNVTSSNGEYGILLSGSDDNTVNGNTVQNNNRNGIHFSDGYSNIVMNNLATGNSHAGIALGDSLFNIVKDNTGNSNGLYGIEVGDADNNILMKNWTEGNVGDGVLICARNNTIKKNTSVNNGGFGFSYILEGTSFCEDVGPTNTFSKNKCTGNTLGGSDPTGLCGPQE
jgi:parallel beta-helix repeat protein